MIQVKTNGRLGNNLMQIATGISLALNNDAILNIGVWEYFKYFNLDNKFIFHHEMPEPEKFLYKEKGFNYQEIPVNTHITIDGYWQSEKYWINNKEKIKELFRFNEYFKLATVLKFPKELDFKKCIALHVRRTDYVGHKQYHNLPPNYYLQALNTFFPDWQTENNIVVFSDDIAYCKEHFGCLDNVYFSEGMTDIEDMALMSFCEHKILSNSTFAWWSSYLSESKGKVIRPTQYFEGTYKNTHDTKDFWPIEWEAFDYTTQRIDLSDTTFVIPFKYDYPDRAENIKVIVDYLRTYFKTHFIFGKFSNDSYDLDRLAFTNDESANFRCDSVLTSQSREFHRTKLINQMVSVCYTPYFCNLDTDILLSPIQIWKAVDKLRKGEDVVYPYDGTFKKLRRDKYLKDIIKHQDIGIFCREEGLKTYSESWGGAIFFNKSSFVCGGMENENFISFGPEDSERAHRFMKLGFKVSRVKGTAWHINHYRGEDSGKHHKHFMNNRAENEKVHKMNKEQLLNYIKEWKWTQ